MRWLDAFDRLFIRSMREWGVVALRLALGIVFLWFGALKIAGVSSVVELIQKSYSFLPYPDFIPLFQAERAGFILFLGVWEALIGLGLIFKKVLRLTLALLWLQMAGTLVALALASALFFTGVNFLLLTMEGEFVVKNLVLIASGIVIGGYEVKPRAGPRKSS